MIQSVRLIVVARNCFAVVAIVWFICFVSRGEGRVRYGSEMAPSDKAAFRRLLSKVVQRSGVRSFADLYANGNQIWGIAGERWWEFIIPQENAADSARKRWIDDLWAEFGMTGTGLEDVRVPVVFGLGEEYVVVAVRLSREEFGEVVSLSSDEPQRIDLIRKSIINRILQSRRCHTYDSRSSFRYSETNYIGRIVTEQ